MTENTNPSQAAHEAAANEAPEATSTSADGVLGVPPAPNTAPEVTYFNFRQHDGVQELRKKGIWTSTGERFGGLEVRLQPFSESEVVVHREQTEAGIRARLTLGEDEQIPGNDQLEITRESVYMAVTGLRGSILGTSEVLRIARQHGVKVDGEIIVLTGDEPKNVARDIARPMIWSSMQFMQVLVGFSRRLQRVPDKDLAAQGEGFVFGRHAEGASGA